MKNLKLNDLLQLFIRTYLNLCNVILLNTANIFRLVHMISDPTTKSYEERCFSLASFWNEFRFIKFTFYSVGITTSSFHRLFEFEWKFLGHNNIKPFCDWYAPISRWIFIVQWQNTSVFILYLCRYRYDSFFVSYIMNANKKNFFFRLS